MRTSKHAICVILTLSFASAMCVAAPKVEAEHYYSEFRNDTGQTANDFHIAFEPGGFELGWLEWGSPSSAAFTDHLVREAGGFWRIEWSGGSVGAGERAEFEFSFSGDKNVMIQEYYWTLNGVKITSDSPKPRDGIGFLEMVPVELSEIIWDCSIPLGEAAAFVQRRAYSTGDLLTPADLARDGAVWQAATVIDAAPVLLSAGTELTATLPYFPAYRGYAFLYDVYLNVGGAPGTRVGMQAIATNVVPEPATLTLMLAAGALALRRRSKRATF